MAQFVIRAAVILMAAAIGSSAARAQDVPVSPERSLVNYDHAAITHSGPAVQDAMVTDALRAWGVATPITDGGQGADIVLVIVPREHTATALALFDDDNRYTGCRIEWPATYGGPDDGAYPWWNQAVMTHEVGHCLGLNHPLSYGLSIMLPNVPAPTPLDIAALAPLYPWPYRLTVPGVTR